MAEPDEVDALYQRVAAELPCLSSAQALSVAASVTRLVGALRPLQIYAFGSQARGTATDQSDVDLLVVVPESDLPGYRRDQQAYIAVGDHDVPLDILTLTSAEFKAKLDSPASLPATVVREGRLLYAA
jgi:predicted nucleotidyltransferase